MLWLLLCVFCIILVIFVIWYISHHDHESGLFSLFRGVNLSSSLQRKRVFLTRKSLKEYLRGLESDIIHVVAPEKLEQFTKKENLDQLKPGTIIFVVDHEFHSTCYSAKNHNDFLNHRQVSLCVASNWYGESHEKLVRIPIGLESNMFEKRHAMTDEFIKLLKGSTEKNGKIIAAGINYSTSRSPKSSYRDDRHALKTELKDSKSVVWTKRQSGIDYLNNLAKHSFSLCPEGNGMDTHRFMESYALGARPIVRRGQMTPLHEQFPGVIFVDWWHDVENIDPSEEKTDPELLYLDHWLYKSLRSRCKIVMFFTSGVIDEWRNFLISARRVNVDDLLMVFPLDVESRDAVVKENILCRDDLLTDKLAKEASFATEAFNDIMISKLKAIEKTLSEGWITFYLDTDIVLLGDPIKEYFKYPAKPIYMQSDEKGFGSGTNHCAGVMTLVPGKENTRCIREAIEMSSSTFDDQKAMNTVVNRKKLGTYDPYFYPNGARWWVVGGMAVGGGRKKIEKLGITPILIHNNYIKGLKAKIDRFKEHGYWYLDAPAPSMLRELSPAVDPTNPKVALCFYGLTRSLKFTIGSIQKHIFNALHSQNVSFDTFMHTYHIFGEYHNPRAKEKTDSYDNTEHEMLGANVFQIDNQDEIKSKLNLEKYRTYPDPWETSYASVDNFILAQYSKMQVTKLVQNSNNSYDYIVFLRPDVFYLQPLLREHMSLVNDTSICIPNFGLDVANFNDRFAITHKENYMIYGNIYENLFEISKKEKLHSEVVISKYLTQHKIAFKHINFNFRRVRIDGTFSDEPFDRRNAYCIIC